MWLSSRTRLPILNLHPTRTDEDLRVVLSFLGKVSLASLPSSPHAIVWRGAEALTLTLPALPPRGLCFANCRNRSASKSAAA